MNEDKKIDLGWTVKELPGVALINPIILLPEEDRKAILEERLLKSTQLREIGEPTKEGEEFVCPNGCSGEFRTHGTSCTMVGWFDGPNPNHFTQSCSCQTCGARFTKHWVPAKNDCKPWFIVGDTWEERKVYSGECQCCCPKEQK